MKRFKYVLMLVLANAFIYAQAQITIEPAEWVPCEQIKLIIDITVGDCDALVGSGPGESLYLWTWMPADPGKNGTWNSSNEDMKLTYEGPNLWSYTMVPTDFYGVESDVIYANGFSLLVKKKDGATTTGTGDCPENKTSDYHLDVAAPFVSKKVFLFPEVVFQDDFMTFLYDETLETKASMQNLSEYYVYAKAIDTDGGTYEVSPEAEVGNNPALKLKDKGDGKYGITVIPKTFFSVPDGKTILNVEFTVRKKVVADPITDQVDEIAAPFELGCGPTQGGC